MYMYAQRAMPLHARLLPTRNRGVQVLYMYLYIVNYVVEVLNLPH